MHGEKKKCEKVKLTSADGLKAREKRTRKSGEEKKFSLENKLKFN
jgi:hypothetical protein